MFLSRHLCSPRSCSPTASPATPINAIGGTHAINSEANLLFYFHVKHAGIRCKGHLEGMKSAAPCFDIYLCAYHIVGWYKVLSSVYGPTVRRPGVDASLSNPIECSMPSDSMIMYVHRTPGLQFYHESQFHVGKPV